MPASPRAGRARLHYVEREDPGDRAAPQPRHGDHHAAAELQHALTHAPDRPPARTGVTRSKNPQATTITIINGKSPYRLTNFFLRWCRRDRAGWWGYCGVMRYHFEMMVIRRV